MGEGRLVLVVGPSGSGKDTLLSGARAALRHDPCLRFVRRLITRPAEAGGEPHVPVSQLAFDQLAATGGFAFSWRAHGLSYGIPRDILDDLAAGRVVVVNGSRATLPSLRERFERLSIIAVNTPPGMLRERLWARARETAAEIDARLARAPAFEIQGPDVIPLVNDGSIAAGVGRLVAILSSFHPTPVTKPL